MSERPENNLILVLGATGYVGARLVPRLLKKGYRVRAAARSMAKLEDRSWSHEPNVELISVDLLDRDSILKAAQGCTIAYYLVHSMGPSSPDFAQADRQAAKNTIFAAEAAGLKRIIYLSGLGEKEDNLSKHLRSRAEVADIFCSASKTVSITVLRAAMIIGSGSASFEILRYLTERLPLMITPRWVRTPSQPIAIRDVLHYLIACLEEDKTRGQIYDIGGPDILSYKELMEIYAEEAELPKRLIIPVPVFTPKLSSYWIHLVTPVPAYIAQPLAEGLRNPTVCESNNIKSVLPHNSLSCRQAIKLAIERVKDQTVESHWTDAGRIMSCQWSMPGDPSWAGGTVYKDSRKLLVDVSSHILWNSISKIGGSTGWYYADWLWQLRGFIDRLLGGVGLRRGRRHQSEILTGDALDFWRVTSVKPEESLSLVAEMKLPGKAFLEFHLRKINADQTEITQTARFIPKGLFGILYWWTLYPLHMLIFANMLSNLVKDSKR